MPPQNVPPGEQAPDTIYFNGIDPDTGTYAVAPISADQLAERVRARPAIKSVANPSAEGVESFGVPFGIDLEKLPDTGWAVVFAEDAPQDLKDALEPLIEHRRSKSGPLFKSLDYRCGEQIRDWYRRHNLAFGNFDPTSVPYYLLIVGPPTSIPFEFQYLLGVEYAVGRLAFDTTEEYRRYALSVVRYEQGTVVSNARQIVYWGTRHAGDPATLLSSTLLLDPLIRGTPDGSAQQQKSVHDAVGFAGKVKINEDGLRGALLSAFTSAMPPAFLFTASHGMALKPGHPDQVRDNGGLLCQDWPGYGAVQREHRFTGADIPDDANVNGMVAFMFACFGGGTPDTDEFLTDLSNTTGAPKIAPRPFVAALPRRLLAHPRGSALAVIGHVDRAWGCSIRPLKLAGSHIAPFRNGLCYMLNGSPVGHVMAQQFGQRYTALAAALLDALKPTRPQNTRPTDRELATSWLETNDARNYIVLGDPAVRIRRDLLNGVA